MSGAKKARPRASIAMRVASRQITASATAGGFGPAAIERARSAATSLRRRRRCRPEEAACPERDAAPAARAGDRTCTVTLFLPIPRRCCRRSMKRAQLRQHGGIVIGRHRVAADHPGIEVAVGRLDQPFEIVEAPCRRTCRWRCRRSARRSNPSRARHDAKRGTKAGARRTSNPSLERSVIVLPFDQPQRQKPGRAGRRVYKARDRRCQRLWGAVLLRPMP